MSTNSHRNNFLTLLEISLRRMKLIDLSIIIGDIPGISWRKIKKHIRDNKLSYNMKEVAKFIVEYIKRTNFGTLDIQNLIALSQLISVSRYPSRKYWYTFHIITDNNNLFCPDRLELISSIQSSVEKSNKKNIIHIYSYLYEGIVWIRIAKYPKKSIKPQSGTQTYFALVLSDNYIFGNRTNPEMSIMQGLVKSFNCQNIKQQKLHGRNIKSLLEILRYKENRTNSVDNVQKKFNFDESYYEESNSGLNCGKYRYRKQYADDMFGERPPQIESVILKTRDIRWHDISPLANKRFDFSLKITSPNVNETLKEAIANNIISTPAPPWCTHLITSGKNVLTMTEI